MGHDSVYRVGMIGYNFQRVMKMLDIIVIGDKVYQ